MLAIKNCMANWKHNPLLPFSGQSSSVFFGCLVASFFGRGGMLGRKFTHGDQNIQNIMAWKRYFLSDNHEMLWVSRYPSEISGVYSPRLAMVMVISSEKRFRINNHQQKSGHDNGVWGQIKSSWWFQPLCKILVKLDHFPR